MIYVRRRLYVRSRVAAIAAVGLIAGCDRMEDLTGDTNRLMGVLLMLGFLLLVLSGTRWRGDSISAAIKNALIWVGLIAALAVGYSYRAELGQGWQRVKSEFLPGTPVEQADGSVRLARSYDGHFTTFALVNGVGTEFIVDTGASRVVLPFEEAIKLGFKEEELDFVQPVSTANGDTFAAPIVIDAFDVGGIRMRNVAASVSEAGALSTPLLGMSFLNRLSGYSFEGDVMTLRE